MVELVRDQAEGLRRMLGRQSTRVVSFASGRTGLGKTSTVFNLAVSLTRRGRDVLVLDHNAGRQGVCGLMGVEPQCDLGHVLRGEKRLDEVIVEGAEGVRVVPLGQGLALLGQAEGRYGDRLLAQLSDAPLADIVLIDTIAGIEHVALSPTLAAQDIVVVVSNQPAVITEAYAMIKVFSQGFACREFYLLVTKTKAEQADGIYENMADAARKFLNVSLHYLGSIADDEKLARSTRLRRAVNNAFPKTPSAATFRELAEKIEEWPLPSGDAGRLESFVRRLAHTSRMAVESSRPAGLAS